MANYFKELSSVSYTDGLKQKMGLKYLSWASAQKALMDVDPYAEFVVIEYTPKIVTENGVIIDGEPRQYHTDGRTCWVKTSITLHPDVICRNLGLAPDEYAPSTITREMWLPVMNMKNAAISCDSVTSTDVNKAIWRCFVKNCAAFGIALHVYDGEEFSDEDAEIKKLQTTCYELIGKKCKLGETQKKKVTSLCKEAIPDGNGDPNLCDDKDTLTALKKSLLSIR